MLLLSWSRMWAKTSLVCVAEGLREEEEEEEVEEEEVVGVKS